MVGFRGRLALFICISLCAPSLCASKDCGPKLAQRKDSFRLVQALDESGKKGFANPSDYLVHAFRDPLTKKRWKWLRDEQGYRLRWMKKSDKKRPEYSSAVYAWSEHDEKFIEFNPRFRGEFKQEYLLDFIFMHEVSDSVYYHKAFKRYPKHWQQREKFADFFFAVLERHPKLSKRHDKKPTEVEEFVEIFFKERRSFLHVIHVVRKWRKEGEKIKGDIDEIRWAKHSKKELRDDIIEAFELGYGIPEWVSRVLWKERLPDRFDV